MDPNWECSIWSPLAPSTGDGPCICRWIERWNGAPPEVIHPIFCIPKPTPKEELADPNKDQRWRVLVDGQMRNKLMVPASGPMSTVENVLNHLQNAARESLRQIRANEA